MKITNVESCTVTIPLTDKEREAGAIGRFPLLKVETDEGIVGHGYAWGADRSYFEGVLRPGLVGKDPFAIEQLLEYGRELNYFTSGGPWPWVVEHALWDIIWQDRRLAGLQTPGRPQRQGEGLPDVHLAGQGGVT